ncbi:TRAP transporter substrate-binding protein [Candidatus Albibeggiatoa sp. nov. NOAA]|uniref:TRAP transporter substrate-binding protein n=1 Tax=Candidatus Albibeggiatoa sp. nov. NOAA TaxID=3162724 RepID=UPI0032F9D1BA|nr:TRAP transporter substrate-binding protein [Thiotrichaceae bacterium]
MKKLLLGFLLLLVGCTQQSDTVEWHMPTPYSDGVFHTQNILHFVEDVETLTEGKFIIHVHSGASVFKHPEIKRAVRSAQVPIGEILISLLGNEDPLFQVDVLPLLATNYDQAQKLWMISRQEIEKVLAQQNLQLLYAVPWPPQGLYVKREINNLDDISGLKIRAYNAMLSRLVQLMGGIPTTVESPEIAQAFSTGVIDAMMTSPSTGVSSQSWDYVSHYYDFQAWIPKNMVIVNKKAFERLEPSLQNKLLQAAQEAEQRGWAMSEKETAEKTQILMDHGIQVMKPSQELSEQLAQIRQQMAQEWEQKAGELGKRILESYNNAQQQLISQNSH